MARFSTPATSAYENDFGTFNFSSSYTTGFDYADFLLGIPQTDSRVARTPVRYNRYTNTELYFQDSWNMTSKLTLTLGLRWEYFQPPVEKNDMRFSFDRKTGNLVVSNQDTLRLVSPMFPKAIPILTAAQAGFPGGRSLLNGKSTNFGPRVSFAYRLTNRTVIRGGYALFYAPMVGGVLEDYTASGPFGATKRTIRVGFRLDF